jgi:hypothetical protein
MSPRKGKLLNISKTVEIPTPKPYIIFFHVLQAIYALHYRYGPWGQIHPLRKIKLLNIWKTIEIPTPKPYIILFHVLHAIYAMP